MFWFQTMKLDPWGRGYPLGLRTQGRGFDSRWVRTIFILDIIKEIPFTIDEREFPL